MHQEIASLANLAIRPFKVYATISKTVRLNTRIYKNKKFKFKFKKKDNWSNCIPFTSEYYY